MNSLLYIIAVVLIIGWAIGFFFMAVGNLIHILLVIAVIAFVIGLIRRPTAL
jgi:phage-related holin